MSSLTPDTAPKRLPWSSEAQTIEPAPYNFRFTSMIRFSLLPLSVILTSLFFPGCATQQTPQTPSSLAPGAARAIKAANKKFSYYYANKDAANVASLYAKDGGILPPNMPKFEGKQAIQGFFNAMMGAGIAGVELTTSDLAGDASWISESGAYTLKSASGNAIDQGKYLVVWKNEDGTWKMYRDIFNSNKPAPNTSKK
ncbi:MAG: DUF4440 domain-containing protein [Verrucomicrobiota bacterium]